jgi:hypothetical protein
MGQPKEAVEFCHRPERAAPQLFRFHRFCPFVFLSPDSPLRWLVFLFAVSVAGSFFFYSFSCVQVQFALHLPQPSGS